MIKITEFKNNVYNVAKANRFLVDINIYTDMFKENPFAGFSSDFFEKMKYLIQDAVIPNRSQKNIPIKYHGMTLEIPGDYEHNDLTLKFISTTDWNVRSFFERWVNLIQVLPDVNLRLDAIPLLNMATIKVSQLGLYEEDIVTEYTFYNIYPKEIGEIKLSMTDESFQTFDVTFAYSHWE